MQTKRIVIMAGGTGGHVFPGLALATELIRRGYEVEWLGTRKGLEAKLVSEANIPLHFIPVEGVRGKGLRSFLKAPSNIVQSLLAARKILQQRQPNLVVGMGGFVAGPGGMAARALGIPLVIHEQNAIAGSTNRILARFAQKVFCAFPDALPGAECIGNPVRKEIEAILAPEARFDGREGPINLLILGGSRGAQAINEFMPCLLSELGVDGKLNIWHQSGAGKESDTRTAYQHAHVNANIEAFIKDIPTALSWADIVVCRSGALTVAELAAAGVGSVLIPFPYAIDDHQTANAKFLADNNAAILVQQKDLDVKKMKVLFEDQLLDRKKLLAMACQARALAKTDVAAKFSDRCEVFIHA